MATCPAAAAEPVFPPGMSLRQSALTGRTLAAATVPRARRAAARRRGRLGGAEELDGLAGWEGASIIALFTFRGMLRLVWKFETV